MTMEGTPFSKSVVYRTTKENADQRLNTIKMSGKEVYKQAVNAMMTAANTAK